MVSYCVEMLYASASESLNDGGGGGADGAGVDGAGVGSRVARKDGADVGLDVASMASQKQQWPGQSKSTDTVPVPLLWPTAVTTYRGGFRLVSRARKQPSTPVATRSSVAWSTKTYSDA
mgnify:CR=1 FL=1